MPPVFLPIPRRSGKIRRLCASLAFLGLGVCAGARTSQAASLDLGELTAEKPWSEASIGGEWSPLRSTTHYDWLTNELNSGKRYTFADPRLFPLLSRYVEPEQERPRTERLLFFRTLGAQQMPLVPQLVWSLDAPENEPETLVAALWAIRPEMLSVTRVKTCPAWARPRTVVVAGWGSDYDRLPLIECDGTIAAFALDRVSVLARVQGTANPGFPLPAEPLPSAEWPEEWVDGVHLLHPRLLWLLQRIGEAFPRRTIQIMSGYRRDANPDSPHRRGRALDLRVSDVDNATLFAYCLRLKDVGCGYYPYHPFVHIDVRSARVRPVVWVDASEPGEPSKYVDAWPGVIESGALAGAGSE